MGSVDFEARRGDQNQGGPGRPGPPEAYLSPVFVPAGDLDVPAGFSKTGDTLPLFAIEILLKKAINIIAIYGIKASFFMFLISI